MCLHAQNLRIKYVEPSLADMDHLFTALERMSIIATVHEYLHSSVCVCVRACVCVLLCKYRCTTM